MQTNKLALSLILAPSLAVTTAWGQTASGLKALHRPPPSLSLSAPLGDASALLADRKSSDHYKFITIPIKGSTYAAADGINDSGLVDGVYYDSNFVAHGFLWHDGVFQKVDYPGAAYTILYSANNRGVIIGAYGDASGKEHAVLYSVWGGFWTAFPDIPGYPENQGYGINDEGMAVGNAFESGTATYPSLVPSVAWIWDPASLSYSFFTVTGAAEYSTAPNDINDNGQVAGWFEDANNNYHGFLKEYGTFTVIDVPGAAVTYPDGLNNNGDIQGQIFVPVAGGYAAEGFVATSGGLFTAVNYPGLTSTSIVGINNRGDVCGAYSENSNPNAYFAFVALRERK